MKVERRVWEILTNPGQFSPRVWLDREDPSLFRNGAWTDVPVWRYDTNDTLRGRDNLLLWPTSYLRLTPAQEAGFIDWPGWLSSASDQNLEFVVSHQNSKTYYPILTGLNTKYNMKCGGLETKMKSLMTWNMKPLLVNQIVNSKFN